ncbi:MAG: GntR family transcriptional regulator [Pseudomonadota bacterium]
MTRNEPEQSNKKDLTSKAYMAIRQMLFYNEILPGQKIKYHDLANRIGVSITPVIQALKWLEFRNIVRHEANKGYYINEVSVKEVREIYNTRLLLEVSLVPDIILRLDEAGIISLEKSFATYQKAFVEDNYYNRMMTDMQFHLNLASLAQCTIQIMMLQELFDMLLLRYSRNLFFLSVTDTSLTEHKRILAAVSKTNQEELCAAVTDHIVGVRNHIIKGMERLVVDRKETMSDLFSY